MQRRLEILWPICKGKVANRKNGDNLHGMLRFFLVVRLGLTDDQVRGCRFRGLGTRAKVRGSEFLQGVWLCRGEFFRYGGALRDAVRGVGRSALGVESSHKQSHTLASKGLAKGRPKEGDASDGRCWMLRSTGGTAGATRKSKLVCKDIDEKG